MRRPTRNDTRLSDTDGSGSGGVALSDSEASRGGSVVCAPSRYLQLTSGLASRVVTVLRPVISVVSIFIIWELAFRVFEVPSYIVPKPSVVLAEIAQRSEKLLAAGAVTLEAIITGFAAGAVIAIVLGFVIASSRFLERSLYYVVVFLQAQPTIALAPLLVVWMGQGLAPKVVLIALATFVPVLVDSIAGFKYINKQTLYVSKSMGATTFQTLVLIRIPTALPFILSGLKLSIILAVAIGIVVEYAASTSGLGFEAVVAMRRVDLPAVFAVIFSGAIIGFGLSAIALYVERLAMPWKRL